MTRAQAFNAIEAYQLHVEKFFLGDWRCSKGVGIGALVVNDAPLLLDAVAGCVKKLKGLGIKPETKHTIGEPS